MKLKLIAAISCILFWYSETRAQTADTVVSITSATDDYRFVYNTTIKSVQIKAKQQTVYQAETFQASVPIAETYNNQVTVDNVTCRVNGRAAKDFEPKHNYYSVDDYFFSDEKICYFPITIQGKESKTEVGFEKTYTDPRYFTGIFFPERFAVKSKLVSITIPRWMKVEIKEFNFDGLNIKKTTQYNQADDADIITYSMENLPASKKEVNSPGPTYIYPHLLIMCKQATPAGQSFTYFNNLDDQYKWYRSLTTDIADDHAQAGAQAKKLIEGKDNSLEGIKAIFYYVQDNIRYIAFEDGLAGFKPDKADEVLRKKYGDCKGMANLLKGMLQAAGYDARLCWLGTNHIAYNYQTPSMAVDNHMICAVNFNNKTYFLDATESNIGFNEYAERIQGRQVLMENGDKYLLTSIPPVSGAQNAYRETGKFTIADSKLTGAINHEWKGEYKEYLLSMLNGIKKDRVEQEMRQYLAGDDSNYDMTGFALPEKPGPEGDFKLAYNVKFAGGISLFGKTYYVDLDRKKEFKNHAIDIAERRHDYWFPHKMDIDVQNELAVPVGYKVEALPPALNISNPNYEFHIAYATQPGKLTYTKYIRIKNTSLGKTAFVQWNKDIEQLIKTYNETVTIKPITE